MNDSMQIETLRMLSPCVSRIYVEEKKESVPEENMSHRGAEADRVTTEHSLAWEGWREHVS